MGLCSLPEAAGELLKLAGFQFQHPNFVCENGNTEAAQRTLDLVQETQRNIDQMWSNRPSASAAAPAASSAPIASAPAPAPAATPAPSTPAASTAPATVLAPVPSEAARPWTRSQPPPGAPQPWVNMTRDIDDPPQPTPAHPAETLPPAIAHPAESEARPQPQHLPIAHPAEAAPAGHLRLH